MNDRPGIGVIGCGTIAYWSHLRSLNSLKNIRIAGIYDPDSAALSRAGQIVDAPAYATAEEMLSSDGVDAVVIASPTGLHASQLRMACEAGVHAYVEKPLAHDAASLAAVRNDVDGTPLVLATGFNYRFHPACRQLRDLLESGAIGDVRAIVSEFTEPMQSDAMPSWKRDRSRGGGVLLDLAMHHIDLYRWLLRDDLLESHASTQSTGSDQDSALLQAMTGKGVELSGYFSFASGRSNGLTVHGTTGVLRLDLHSVRISLARNRRHGYGVRYSRPRTRLFDLGWRIRKQLSPSYNPSYRAAMAAFAQAVIDPSKRDPDLATMDDGLVALQAVLDAESSQPQRGQV